MHRTPTTAKNHDIDNDGMRSTGTIILGEMNRVRSGTAKIENPKPVKPCKSDATKKIRAIIILF
ncbi:MAG: hypothetical protein SVM86_05595 [Candidatus Cloacimonadota bacterium]|nr:hypothetical protein [Candidatus Cloacimonadota bacterium]